MVSPDGVVLSSWLDAAVSTTPAPQIHDWEGPQLPVTR